MYLHYTYIINYKVNIKIKKKKTFMYIYFAYE